MPDEIQTIDDYIASSPTEARPVLEQIRQAVHQIAPGAEETISYKMPTITMGGTYLVYFAAWKHHVSLHAIPPFDEPLESKVAPFRSGKDTVRFPLKEPLPVDLVKQIVAELVARR